MSNGPLPISESRDGDDSSVAGSVNCESLVDRLAVRQPTTQRCSLKAVRSLDSDNERMGGIARARPSELQWQTASRPLDIRYIDDDAISGPSVSARCLLFRAEGVDTPDRKTHRASMTFGADRSLLPAIAKPRGERSGNIRWSAASVDHALWFHSDVHTGERYTSTFRIHGFIRRALQEPKASSTTHVATHE